jgi:hypothetical protein
MLSSGRLAEGMAEMFSGLLAAHSWLHVAFVHLQLASDSEKMKF